MKSENILWGMYHYSYSYYVFHIFVIFENSQFLIKKNIIFWGTVQNRDSTNYYRYDPSCLDITCALHIVYVLHNNV